MDQECGCGYASGMGKGRTFTVIRGALCIPRVALCLKGLPEPDIGGANKTGQIGDAGHGDGSLEAVGVADDEHGHIAAIAVTRYDQSLRVGYSSRNALIDASHDILVVPATPVALDFAHKCLPIAGAAMGVAVKNGEALRCKILVVRIHARTKGRMHATVSPDDERITHSFSRSDGTYQPTLDVITGCPLVMNAFWLAPSKLAQLAITHVSEALRFSGSCCMEGPQVQLPQAERLRLCQHHPLSVGQ